MKEINIVIWILYIIGLINAEKQWENIRITEFENGNGLFYEKLPDLQIVAGAWRAVSFVDTESLNNYLPSLTANLKKLEESCKKILQENCEELMGFTSMRSKLDIFTMQWNQLQEAIKELSDQNPPMKDKKSNKFSKGNVSSFEFKVGSTSGQLTPNDEETSEEIFQAERNIFRLMEEEKDERKEETLNYQRKLNKDDKSKNWNNTLYLQAAVKSWEGLLNSYDFSLKQTLQVMYEAIEGKIHPLMISNRQLVEIVKDAQKYLKDLEFPLPISKISVASLQKVSMVSSMIIKKYKLIMAMDIPLLDTKKYQLFKLHELPVLQKGKLENRIYIKPSAKYLATDSEIKEYFYLEEEDIEACKTINERYLCRPKVIYDSVLTPSCETNLLKNPTNGTPKNCDIRIMENRQPFWSAADYIGAWLYSLLEEETAKLTCMEEDKPEFKEDNREFKIKGIGVIRLGRGCSLSNEKVKISALIAGLWKKF